MTGRMGPRGIVRWLLLAGLLLLALGTWLTVCDRALIRPGLDAGVLVKEIRTEKHPPLDDVHILVLEDESGVRVERRVDGNLFDSMDEGDRLHKEAWSHDLSVSGRTLPLRLSSESRGTALAMTAIAAIALLWMLAAQAICRRH